MHACFNSIAQVSVITSHDPPVLHLSRPSEKTTDHLYFCLDVGRIVSEEDGSRHDTAVVGAEGQIYPGKIQGGSESASAMVDHISHRPDFEAGASGGDGTPATRPYKPTLDEDNSTQLTV